MELKPCPFCGNKAAAAMEMYAPGRWVHAAECRHCKVAFTNLFCSKEEAVERWNHRPIEDALRAELENVRSRLMRAKRGARNLGLFLRAEEGITRSATRILASLRAELTKERARLNALLEWARWPAKLDEFLAVQRPQDFDSDGERDVIDRLLGEVGE